MPATERWVPSILLTIQSLQIPPSVPGSCMAEGGSESALSTRALVEDFVCYKLCQKGYGCKVNTVEQPTCALHAAMRAAGDEFEVRFRRAFCDVSMQLHITPETAYRRFADVVDELFEDGVNWGRVVAFFVFGAALCAESMNKEMAPLVERIKEWMERYLETSLQDWMASSGGWNGFLSLYGEGAIGEARRQREGNWASVKTVLTGAVALGALMTVGALFASK